MNSKLLITSLLCLSGTGLFASGVGASHASKAAEKAPITLLGCLKVWHKNPEKLNSFTADKNYLNVEAYYKGFLTKADLLFVAENPEEVAAWIKNHGRAEDRG